MEMCKSLQTSSLRDLLLQLALKVRVRVWVWVWVWVCVRCTNSREGMSVCRFLSGKLRK